MAVVAESGSTQLVSTGQGRKEEWMKVKFFTAIIMLACLAQAREPKPHQTGTLLQMDSAECGVDEKSGKTFVGEVMGTDSAHQKKRVLLCQEYILQGDTVIYRIRPRDEKHPVLLPVGEKAQFRLDKDKMKLRVEDLDDKERDYIVVSMTPRGNSNVTEKATK